MIISVRELASNDARGGLVVPIPMAVPAVTEPVTTREDVANVTALRVQALV
jgi:hypothetical protein